MAERLPAYLNLVLIQTGKVLRASDYRGPKAIGLAKSKVNEYVSAANGSFHDALDEVELKILEAKSVMERDLSVIRKKRALREGVKIPLPAPSPIEIVPETSNDAMQIEDLQIDASGDLPMLDSDLLTSQLQNDEGAANQSLLTGDGMMIDDQTGPQDATGSAGLAITLPEETSANEKDGAKTSTETNPNTGAKMEDIMGTLDGQEPQAETNDLDFDFESMFNDPNFVTTDGPIDFNVDFPSTGEQVNNGQSDNGFTNVAVTTTDLGDIPPTSNEDITSLLDDVFNQSADIANGVPLTTSTAPDAAKQDGVISTAEAAPSATDPLGTEPSEFDDLFGGADTFDLGGDGNLGDFNMDDEWLKM